MSNQEQYIVSTAPRLAALLGGCLICLIGAGGCDKQKEERGSTASGPTSTDKGGGATAANKGGDSGTPGVTATEIKIGQTMPYSGPQSAYGVIGKTEQAYFRMINEKGGINGRKVNLISLDDSYTPAKTVEQTRKLVESEGVSFIFGSVGTGMNTSIQKYLNDRKVPHLFIATGAGKWANPQAFPWTMGWQPSYRTEAKIYALYLMKEKPAAKMCVIYQNDDFGKDYVIGLKEALGEQYDKVVVKEVPYEAGAPSVDSEVVSMQAAGCDTLLTATTPKYGAQVIRKVYDLGWKPLHFVSNVSVSITAALKPAGLDKSTGIITGQYLKDNDDPTYANDPGMNEYRAFIKKYMPDQDPSDGNSIYGYGVAGTLAHVLTACGTDLSGANIMKQAQKLDKYVVPVTVEGVELTTSPSDFRPISQMRLARFNGKNFVPFTELINGEGQTTASK
jgi:branched-chain amino acid transport system substrate-binding protein